MLSKGEKRYKQPKYPQQLTDGFADSLRVQKKGGVCIICVNIACCFYPWLYTGCHHQKGGVCKGKSVIKHTITGFDDDK